MGTGTQGATAGFAGKRRRWHEVDKAMTHQETTPPDTKAEKAQVSTSVPDTRDQGKHPTV
jgi:hypothetical protein